MSAAAEGKTGGMTPIEVWKQTCFVFDDFHHANLSQKRLAERAKKHHSAKTADELREDLAWRFESAEERREEVQAMTEARAADRHERAAKALESKAKIAAEGGPVQAAEGKE